MLTWVCLSKLFSVTMRYPTEFKAREWEKKRERERTRCSCTCSTTRKFITCTSVLFPLLRLSSFYFVVQSTPVKADGGVRYRWLKRLRQRVERLTHWKRSRLRCFWGGVIFSLLYSSDRDRLSVAERSPWRGEIKTGYRISTTRLIIFLSFILSVSLSRSRSLFFFTDISPRHLVATVSHRWLISVDASRTNLREGHGRFPHCKREAHLLGD